MGVRAGLDAFQKSLALAIHPVSIPRPRPARSLFTVSTELLVSDSKPC
jgi:hypothetical protein